MSFQEVKNVEGEAIRLEKLYTREKDWTARKVLADQIMGFCRRLADLEKRAFVSTKVHSEVWIPRFTREQEDCVLMPLEEQVTAIGKMPFSPETYDAKKQSIETLLGTIIAEQKTRADATRFNALLHRLWEISVAEDENLESHRKLTR